MEVDASDSGVGPVLSQREESSGKLKPFAFFSGKLSPAECNYDMSKRELLAINLALEEWHHRLEEQFNHSSFGHTIRTWLIFALLRGSTHGKHVGAFFLSFQLHYHVQTR